MVAPVLVKFGSLVIKTLTKPLGNSIKRKAQQEGWIRQACLRYGRLHHNFESRAKLRLFAKAVSQDMQLYLTE